MVVLSKGLRPPCVMLTHGTFCLPAEFLHQGSVTIAQKEYKSNCECESESQPDQLEA